MQCMESFRPKSHPNGLKTSQSSKGFNSKPIPSSKEGKNEMKRSSSLWNLLWNETSVPYASSPRNSITEHNADANLDSSQVDRISNIHELIIHFSKNETVPSLISKSVNSSVVSFNGNIVDASTNFGNNKFDNTYDLLRTVLDCSKVDMILFTTDHEEDGIAVVSLFDALMKALTDILNLIISLQNPIAVCKLQVDAVLLLEWISKIILANVSLATCLWNKLLRSIFTMIFEIELTKIITKAPFFLEQSIVVMFHLASRLISQEDGSSSSDQSVNVLTDEGRDLSSSCNEAIWQGLRLLQLLPVSIAPDIGSRLSVGLLSFVRASPVLATMGDEKWSLLTNLLSLSSVDVLGRVFAWETLTNIIDNNHVNFANFNSIRCLVGQYLHGDFSPMKTFVGNPKNYDFSNPDDSDVDISLPWLRYALMHVYKLTLIVVSGSTHKDEDVITISLPPWPHQNAADQDLRQIDYKVSSEEVADHETNNDLNAEDRIVYRATHMILKPVSLPFKEAESMWLQSCNLMSKLVEDNGSEISIRALYCLQGLIEAGSKVHFSKELWPTLIVHLLKTLPLEIRQSLVQDPNSDAQATHIHSAITTCSLFHQLIVDHVLDIQHRNDFNPTVIKFTSIVTNNLMVSDPTSESGVRFFEMLASILKLLLALINIQYQSSSVIDESEDKGGEMLALSDEENADQDSDMRDLQSFDDDNEDMVYVSDHEGKIDSAPAPEGLFQFVTELLGFSGTPGQKLGMYSPERAPSRISNGTVQTPLMTPSYVDPNISPSEIPALTAVAMNLSCSETFHTPAKVTSHPNKMRSSSNLCDMNSPVLNSPGTSSTTLLRVADTAVPSEEATSPPVHDVISNTSFQALQISVSSQKQLIKTLYLIWTTIVTAHPDFSSQFDSLDPVAFSEISGLLVVIGDMYRNSNTVCEEPSSYHVVDASHCS